MKTRDPQIRAHLVNLVWLAAAAAAVIASQAVSALDNGLALTPPMGWLAWERYVCETDCSRYPGECIDSNLFRAMAKRLAEDGYKQLGYEYVNIDDCWSTRQRDNSTSRLVPDPARFPSMIELANELHSLGLKLGIYGDCGTETCQLFPGQLKYKDNLTGNYFELDAQTFAEWQIDSFKFDGCALNVSQAGKICPRMGDALNATKRPMLFSCSWPAYENDEQLPTNWSQVVEKCNLWRAFGDIEDSWKSVLETIDYFVKQQDLVVKYHGPGHWFDADQLIVGDFGLSFVQEQAQMAIWSVWASPLYMSNDLRRITKESRDILQNKWLIEVNQDKLGIFGLMVNSTRYLQAFVKPVEPIVGDCPSYAIVYLDRRTLGNGRYSSFRLLDLISSVHDKLALADPAKWAGWLKCATSKEATFGVYDLYDNFAQINRNLSLANDNLLLRTDPSGVKAIKLIRDDLKAGRQVSMRLNGDIGHVREYGSNDVQF